MPYHAILGEIFGLILGSGMRRTTGQQTLFKVVDSKSHLASMPCRTFVCGTPFPHGPYAKTYEE
jgi:hypothetical protein